MRALIEERIHDGAKGIYFMMFQATLDTSFLKTYPENILYFGCRSAHKDQHYGSEWENQVRAGTLRYRLSCSRDGKDGTAKVYVQHLLEQDAKLVWDILNQQRGCLYISGYVTVYLLQSCKMSIWRSKSRSSNKMPVAVKKAIEHAAMTEGELTDVEAKRFITKLEREGRLFEECWS